MQSQNHNIETVNDLITTTIDSVDGYREAGEDANSRQFRSVFFDRANERQEIADRLQEYVRELGGTPTDAGSLTAGVHRVFMNLRDVVTGADDRAVVAEVERGEDYLKMKFEDALADVDLDGNTRSVVSQCYQSVKSGHDQMSNLKHGLNAA